MPRPMPNKMDADSLRMTPPRQSAPPSAMTATGERRPIGPSRTRLDPDPPPSLTWPSSTKRDVPARQGSQMEPPPAGAPKQRAEVMAADPLPPRSRSGSTEPFAVLAPEPKPTPGELRVNARQIPEPEARPSLPENGEMQIRPPAAAGQIPRCCATCRDFRPAESGRSGLCNNRYAFDHRQMVPADGVACTSTIGDWWVPTDDWWMRRGDISHHGRPTPNVDEYLQRLLRNRKSARRLDSGT